MKINTKEFDSLKKHLEKVSNFDKSLEVDFQQGITNIFEHIWEEMPRKTGLMQNSLGKVYGTGLSAEIGLDDSICKYGKWVYGGAPAHTIKPTRAKSLQWFVNGQVRYSKVVNIPERKPNPFLDNIYYKYEPEFIANMEEAIKEQIEG